MATDPSKQGDDSASPPRTTEQFVTISLNADAKEIGRGAWLGRYAVEHVDARHLDLRHLARGTFVSPENLHTARGLAYAFLEEHGLRGHQGRIELFARAKLSFMTWLGWEMRFCSDVAVHNFYSKTLRRFEQPGRIRFSNLGSYKWLRPFPTVLPPSARKDENGDAVVIVDPFGQSTEGQLAAFVSSGGASPLKALDAYRLAGEPGEVVHKEWLEPILEDVIELIGQLRHHRGTRRVHLGLAVPDVVAFYLGQQLNAQGVEILLYEFHSENAGQYRFAFNLERNAA